MILKRKKHVSFHKDGLKLIFFFCQIWINGRDEKRIKIGQAGKVRWSTLTVAVIKKNEKIDFEILKKRFFCVFQNFAFCGHFLEEKLKTHIFIALQKVCAIIISCLLLDTFSVFLHFEIRSLLEFEFYGNLGILIFNYFFYS